MAVAVGVFVGVGVGCGSSVEKTAPSCNVAFSCVLVLSNAVLPLPSLNFQLATRPSGGDVNSFW